MKSSKFVTSLLFAASAVATGAANAAITNTSVVTFENMTVGSYAGFANNAPPAADGKCSGSGLAGCYYESGLAVGIVQDTSNPTAHLHRDGPTGARVLGYHADSSGIYIRAQDSTAFKLTSLDFSAAIDADHNPDSGPNDFWEILGYSSALNPGLDTAANSGPDIVRKTINNGFDDTVVFDDTWNNVKAVWIHYNGFQQTPTENDAKVYGMTLDNVTVNAAVPPSNVPVPAAVWLFGTGLMGFLAMGKKKRFI